MFCCFRAFAYFAKRTIDLIFGKMIWNNRSKGSDVLSLIFWVYGIGRVFGFWPFSIKFNAKTRRSSEVHVTTFDCVWFFISIAMFALSSRFINIDQITQYSFIEMLMTWIIVINDIFVMVFAIIFDMVNRNVLWGIVTNLMEFDDEVSARINKTRWLS